MANDIVMTEAKEVALARVVKAARVVAALGRHGPSWDRVSALEALAEALDELDELEECDD